MEYNIDEINEKANYCLNCKVKPCHKGCPLGNNIPDFIKCVKSGMYEDAYNVLLETTVLQSICGRICPHEKQCQGSCVRGIKSTPVSIGDLEAFVGDIAIKNNYKIKKTDINNGKKVAIIGGGPAGLTCAAFLAKSGFDVTIYEKHSKLGGLLRHGIPEFRLSKNLLDNAIQKILDLDINVICNKELGKDYNLNKLLQMYDAIFLSFGANISSKMNIPGENLEGVFGGNELIEHNLHPNYYGKNVVVIGGGNVAMDVARTVKHMGCSDVTIVYRRAEEQMPAERKEIEDAKLEGINFMFQTNVIKINGNAYGSVNSIECVKTELVQKEGELRAIPINIENSNFSFETDYVMMAVGSHTESALVSSLGIELDKKGYIKTDDNFMTSIKGVFAGGDLIGTKSTVAWAARNGRDVAESIQKYLS